MKLGNLALKSEIPIYLKEILGKKGKNIGENSNFQFPKIGRKLFFNILYEIILLYHSSIQKDEFQSK
ncbi:hypothetical protein H3C61_03765 [Candidatus Gracilibacteria bacterium]|nr:hypothetical protein [Candidatus Gracilibacteria bacterium]